MKHVKKYLTIILVAAVLMLALAGCCKGCLPVVSDEPEENAAQQAEQSEETPASSAENLPASTEEPIAEADESTEEPWKTALADDLYEKYGVLPEYYEDLGDGIYQVYVKIDGKMVPFVTVNSITGDYHG